MFCSHVCCTNSCARAWVLERMILCTSLFKLSPLVGWMGYTLFCDKICRIPTGLCRFSLRFLSMILVTSFVVIWTGFPSYPWKTSYWTVSSVSSTRTSWPVKLYNPSRTEASRFQQHHLKCVLTSDSFFMELHGGPNCTTWFGSLRIAPSWFCQ